MAIEYRERGVDGKKQDVVMTACPFCGTDMDENEGFADHAPFCPAPEVGDGGD